VPYRILLLKDRRPGHYRKSDGVATAIARHIPISVADIAVRAPFGLPARLQRKILEFDRLGPALLRLVWGIRPESIAPPDLIISTGADTLAPNALLARHFGCRNVFVGTIRDASPKNFSAVLSARPELSGRARHFIVLSPSGVDPDTLRTPTPVAASDRLRSRTLALLIGGPAPGYAFSDADWDNVKPLLQAGSDAGVNWFVTTSRRTPDAVADRLAAAAASLPGIVQFIDYRQASAGSIDPLFNTDAILVTEDSNTMISEAVAARRPVVVLRPERLAAEMSSLGLLRNEARVGIVPMREATIGRVVEAAVTCRPLEENPMETLYRLLSQAGIVPATP
jgi:mitochondrial fission protein ELM1